MVDIEETIKRLQDHARELTVTIGERSVRLPDNLEKTARYIEAFYGSLGLAAERESYRYRDMTVANVVTKVDFSASPSRQYLLGAHLPPPINNGPTLTITMDPPWSCMF